MRFSTVLRTVALFEISKGLLVLVAGISLTQLLHRSTQAVAEQLVTRFHLDPATHYVRMFLNAMGQLNDGKLWLMMSFAMFYALVRFTEAYGLWRGRIWAEWFAALSGGIYVPYELFELIRNPGWLSVATLIINLLIVGFMVYGLWRNKQPAKNSQ